MIVVLEGPDFAGKSTTAERLTSLFGGDVRWVGQPPASADLVAYYLDPIRDAVSRPDLVVFDRLHISELVYGPIFRGTSRLSRSQAAEIERELDAVGVLKVHIDAPDSLLLERFRGPRGDDMVADERRLLEVAHAYRRLLGGSRGLPRWPTISLDALISTLHTRLERNADVRGPAH